MGAWGTSIYSNDIAEDVKEACQAIFSLYETEEGNQLIFYHFKDLCESFRKNACYNLYGEKTVTALMR